jgi:hypothetical protein
MTKTKKNKRDKIKKHRKTQKKRNKVTRRNFKKPNKILFGGGSVKDTFLKLFYKQPVSKTDNNSLDRTEPKESYFSEGDFDDDFDDFDDDHIDVNPQTFFLESLKNSIIEIDNLDLSNLTLDDSNELKDYLKRKLMNLYELSNNELSKINPAGLRLMAGTILSKTFVLETFSNCPECPSISKIDDSIKKKIRDKLNEIFLKPYRSFAAFENVVQNAQPKEPEPE